MCWLSMWGQRELGRGGQSRGCPGCCPEARKGLQQGYRAWRGAKAGEQADLLGGLEQVCQLLPRVGHRTKSQARVTAVR